MLNILQSKGKKIIFVRHGESEGNAKGLDDSSLIDVPNYGFVLSERGYEQARLAGGKLRELGLSWDRAFISTYLRTRQTWWGINDAYPICSHAPIIDSRLNEWWRGIWHTMNRTDIDKYYPLEDHIKAREGWYHYRAPGGQSGQDVELQIYSFLSDFMYGPYKKFKKILIVGHGQWAILFWRILTGATVEEAENRKKFKPFGNCSITIFDNCLIETIEK
ncbi:MAG: histidine phosphatase family protein [Candidatus Buchananbacteria bacterium]|nr:histidine phosphatase family protein [Candidatus Buchananbacteria bacterium]